MHGTHEGINETQLSLYYRVKPEPRQLARQNQREENPRYD